MQNQGLGLADEQFDNGSLGVVVSLSGSMSAGQRDLADAVTLIKDGSAAALQSVNQLDQTRGMAAIEVAKASGADYFGTDTPGVTRTIDRVMRRQYDQLQGRYERALEAAKREAYLARLAVEQRLGVRLEDMTTTIGPLQAPSQWAEDVCSLRGVDYETLAKDDWLTSDEINSLAEPFIGEYVGRLEQLVDFYNVEYPFQEGQDQAVLSLREDLLSYDGRCERESVNELYYSHELWAAGEEGDNGESERGWARTCCLGGYCLGVTAGEALAAPDEDAAPEDPELGVVFEHGLPPTGVGGTTWLHVTDYGSELEEDSVVCRPDALAPKLSAYQTVDLRTTGSYALSWWAKGLTGDGTSEPAGDVPYRVAVYNKDWGLVHFSEALGLNGDWGAVEQASFTVPQVGLYHVVFSLEADIGVSLLIGNVQLQQASTLASTPQYEPVGASRMVGTGDCGAPNAQAFRQMFSRACTDGECWYVLEQPVRLDTVALDGGTTDLAGQLAKGNYNYRHINLALNVVGTGVLDCESSGSSSCYGSGYLSYDLEHVANNVPILNYGGERTCFDFRMGQIAVGKHLLRNATSHCLSASLTETSCLSRPWWRPNYLAVHSAGATS